MLTLMKKNGKKKYIHGDISIEVIPEGEKLKVRIASDDED